MRDPHFDAVAMRLCSALEYELMFMCADENSDDDNNNLALKKIKNENKKCCFSLFLSKKIILDPKTREEKQ
jgi:hypothetical protein